MIDMHVPESCLAFRVIFASNALRLTVTPASFGQFRIARGLGDAWTTAYLRWACANLLEEWCLLADKSTQSRGSTTPAGFLLGSQLACAPPSLHKVVGFNPG